MKFSKSGFRNITGGLILAAQAFAMGNFVASAEAAEFNWAAPMDVYTLDPHAVYNTFLFNVMGNVYEPLVRRNPDLTLEPALATEWKQDGETWTFKLRQNVKFHDGSPFSADDVVFSYERSKNAGVKNLLIRVASLEKLDDHTIVIKTKGVDPILPSEISEWLIMSKIWAEKNSAVKAASADNKEESFATRNANGTGSFKIVEREPNVRTVMVPNKDWWDKAAHNIDKSTFQVIANAATRVSALQSGQIDLITDVPPQDAARIEKDGDIQVLSGPDMRVVYLQMDVNRDELLFSDVKGKNPFKDQKVRDAMRLAIDSKIIQQKIMRNFSIPTASMVAREVAGYDEKVGAVIAADVKQAKQLMVEAGYGDGFRVTLDCSTDRLMMDETICITVSGMLSRIGIKAEPRAQTTALWAKQINPPAYNTSFSLLGYAPSTFDALNMLQTIVGSRDPQSGRGIFNVGGYSDAKVDELINQIQVESDADKRNRQIGEALTIVRDSAAYIPLHQQMLLWGLKKNIHVKQRPDGGLALRYVTID